jgi:hypothetical protein
MQKTLYFGVVVLTYANVFHSILPTIPKSQYHDQANAFLFQPESTNNWTKVSYKQSRSLEDETEIKKNKKPNTAKKVNACSTNLPLPTATQPY